MLPITIKSLGFDFLRKLVVFRFANFGPNESFKGLIKVNSTAESPLFFFHQQQRSFDLSWLPVAITHIAKRKGFVDSTR
jgi:hypothetical protein